MVGFHDRVVLVTGGSGSIGAGVAERFAAEGARVVILGRDRVKLEQVASNILTIHPHSEVVCESVDTSSKVELESCVDRLGKLGLEPDTIVTCAAGPAAATPFLEISEEDLNALIASDLKGVLFACQVFGAGMLHNKFGRIINLTSFHNAATYPYRVSYNLVKSGVQGLSRALSVELGHRGITVNTIAPGPIDTPRTRWFLEQDPQNFEGMIGRTPVVKLGTVEQVAALTFFLASNEAGHITGQEIVIDGGWTKNAWWGDHSRLASVDE